MRLFRQSVATINFFTGYYEKDGLGRVSAWADKGRDFLLPEFQRVIKDGIRRVMFGHPAGRMFAEPAFLAQKLTGEQEAAMDEVCKVARDEQIQTMLITGSTINYLPIDPANLYHLKVLADSLMPWVRRGVTHFVLEDSAKFPQAFIKLRTWAEKELGVSLIMEAVLESTAYRYHAPSMARFNYKRGPWHRQMGQPDYACECFVGFQDDRMIDKMRGVRELGYTLNTYNSKVRKIAVELETV